MGQAPKNKIDEETKAVSKEALVAPPPPPPPGFRCAVITPNCNIRKTRKRKLNNSSFVVDPRMTISGKRKAS